MTPLQKRCVELHGMAGVIAAKANGKTIQYFGCGTWSDQDEDDVTLTSGWSYRIKPEPQYRPFTPEEAVKCIGRFVSSNSSRSLGVPPYQIQSVGADRVYFQMHGNDFFKTLLKFYTFFDNGSPCGVRIDP
jgi:hypothetical protein